MQKRRGFVNFANRGGNVRANNRLQATPAGAPEPER